MKHTLIPKWVYPIGEQPKNLVSLFRVWLTLGTTRIPHPRVRKILLFCILIKREKQINTLYEDIFLQKSYRLGGVKPELQPPQKRGATNRSLHVKPAHQYHLLREPRSLGSPFGVTPTHGRVVHSPQPHQGANCTYGPQYTASSSQGPQQRIHEEPGTAAGLELATVCLGGNFTHTTYHHGNNLLWYTLYKDFRAFACP